VLAKFPGSRVGYVPTEQFTNELIAAIQARQTSQFHTRYRRIDVLLVDDAHFLAGKEGTQEEFFHTFNALHDAQKQIVLTSDRPPKEIPGLQDRLVSRFEWGLVTDIKPPDFETRVAILQFKAEQDGLALDRDVLTFIAQRCRSSVRELEGAIIKLLAYSSLTRREISPELAAEVLGGAMGPLADLSPETIEVAVAEAFGVSTADLYSKGRQRRITDPRQVAMYLEKVLLDLPYTRIGARFGGRDHSTVIHSIQKVEQQLAQDSEFRRRVEQLRKRFT
jgi:chromosomal replication initiator protein